MQVFSIKHFNLVKSLKIKNNYVKLKFLIKTKTLSTQRMSFGIEMLEIVACKHPQNLDNIIYYELFPQSDKIENIPLIFLQKCLTVAIMSFWKNEDHS